MKIWKEFKEFAFKGNVIDLAVGVIIGGAFKAIVDSLVNNILMPVIGGLTGGIDLSQLSFTIRSTSIAYGMFLNAIINFLIISLAIFVAIKVVSKARRQKEEKEEEVISEEIQLLREIRDSLKK